jgi:uncharacterized membrane protein YjjP (DUF1212 family)
VTAAPLEEVGAAVATVGAAMLGTGTASYRAERGMQRAGAALGCDHVFTLITLQKVVVTVERDGQSWTEGASAARLHVNAEHLDGLERLVRHLPDDATPQLVGDQLDSVLARRSPYPDWFVAVAVGAACAGFAGLSGGGPVEMGAAFVGAGLAQRVRAWLMSTGLNPFLVVALTAMLAAGIYLAVVDVLQALGLAQDRSEAGFVSAVLLLVPGFPLVTGTLDLLRTQVESGLARLAYATTVLVMAAVGVLAVSAVAEPESTGMRDSVIAQSGWLGALLLTFVSAWGFAVLFTLPPRLTLAAGGVAVAGNALRLALLEGSTSVQLAAFAGALTIGLGGALLAPRLHVSRIVLTIPAVIPMVPGAAAYSALVSLSTNALLPALSSGLEAGLVVLALALGLAVARILTDREWAFPT